jgi:hypothetical protein
MDRLNWIYILTHTLLALAQPGLSYITMAWNTTQYFGPDGPWQGVLAAVNVPGDWFHTQPVTLYPWVNGGASSLLTTDTCSLPHADATCGVGGLIKPQEGNWGGGNKSTYGLNSLGGYSWTYTGDTIQNGFQYVLVAAQLAFFNRFDMADLDLIVA